MKKGLTGNFSIIYIPKSADFYYYIYITDLPIMRLPVLCQNEKENIYFSMRFQHDLPLFSRWGSCCG